MSALRSTRTSAFCLVATLAVAALTAGCGASPLTLGSSSSAADLPSAAAGAGSAAASPGSDGSVLGGMVLQVGGSDEFLLVRKGNLIIAMNQDDSAGNAVADLTGPAAPYISALG